jgi:hypothetical protein
MLRLAWPSQKRIYPPARAVFSTRWCEIAGRRERPLSAGLPVPGADRDKPSKRSIATEASRFSSKTGTGRLPTNVLSIVAMDE